MDIIGVRGGGLFCLWCNLNITMARIFNLMLNECDTDGHACIIMFLGEYPLSSSANMILATGVWIFFM